jgi:hypothetical protein
MEGEVKRAGQRAHDRLTLVFTDANPAQMGIMRIDLTADVKDITVPWCKPRIRFKYKRIQKEYGELKYGTIGRGEVETIWAGCRPNVFRIYNKVAESKVQFRRMQLRAGKNGEQPDFEREFGFKKTDILTRIERQCGGNRIPPQLETFGDLHNAPDFNPFDVLEIVSSGHPNLPTPGECEGLEYYTGIGMHIEAQRLGMQQFRKSLNQQSKGNAARTIERYRRFFADKSETPITEEQIYGIYRDSVQKQLAA